MRSVCALAHFDHFSHWLTRFRKILRLFTLKEIVIVKLWGPTGGPELSFLANFGSFSRGTVSVTYRYDNKFNPEYVRLITYSGAVLKDTRTETGNIGHVSLSFSHPLNPCYSKAPHLFFFLIFFFVLFLLLLRFFPSFLLQLLLIKMHFFSFYFCSFCPSVFLFCLSFSKISSFSYSTSSNLNASLSLLAVRQLSVVVVVVCRMSSTLSNNISSEAI